MYLKQGQMTTEIAEQHVVAIADAKQPSSESAGDEGDYESDSDETSTLAMRRREASDDEEEDMGRIRSHVREECGAHQDVITSHEGERSRLPYSDDDDDEGIEDREGAPPLYEDDGEDELLVEVEAHDSDSLSRQLFSRRRKGSDGEDDFEHASGNDTEERTVCGRKHGEGPETSEVAGVGVTEVLEEEKKEAEPFVVPTSGAFYMHDDRFRDNGGGRPRRSIGGRKLWEAKDEKPWVHDLFEELNLGHDKFSIEGIGKGGRGRGRGRSQGKTRGRGGVGREGNVEDSSGLHLWNSRRGQGSRTEIAVSGIQEGPRAGNYSEKKSKVGTAIPVINQGLPGQHLDSTVSKKPVGGSHLNSASPPFIPSGALQKKLASKVVGTKEIGATSGSIHYRGSQQYVSRARLSSTQAVSDTANFPKSTDGSRRGSVSGNQTQSLAQTQSDDTRHKNAQHQFSKQESSSVSQLHKPERKALNCQNLYMHGSEIPAQQSGRGTPSQNLAISTMQQLQVLGQTQRPEEEQSVTANPHSAPHTSLFGVRSNSSLTPNNVQHKGNGFERVSLVGSIPVGGSGAYIFAGGPPHTALGVGDVEFQQTSIGGSIQYAGQSSLGSGFPPVGMSMPNYPFGFHNSEVTWVPVLSGGGALGGCYGTPYIAMDGAATAMYYPQASAQSVQNYHLTGKDITAGKHRHPGGLWKPPPSPELGSDEFGQRQSKPRRYSEMNFGQ